MQQRLVLLVPHAELLQEQVSEPNDLLHLHVVLQTRQGRINCRPPHHSSTAPLMFAETGSHLVIGDLQQVQHDFVSSHVLQQPLLLLPHAAAAHLVEPLQDLLRANRSKGGARDFSLLKSHRSQTVGHFGLISWSRVTITKYKDLKSC